MKTSDCRNTVEVLSLIVRKFKIPISIYSIKSELSKHPYCNTLLAVSETLTKWNISNSAFKLQVSEISPVYCPFITTFTTNNLGYFLVNTINSQGFLIEDSNEEERYISESEFFNNYSGNILAIDPDVHSGDPNFKFKIIYDFLNKYRFYLVFFLASLFVFTIFIQNNYFNTYGLLILVIFSKFIGIILSIVLIHISTDENNQFDKFCHGKKINCKDVIKSKAAFVFGLISWMDIGIFYFVFTFILLLFSNNSNFIFEFLELLSFTSILYVIYSLYYQTFILKKWCLYCCAVQMLLIFEASVFWTKFQFKFYTPSYEDLRLIFDGLCFPVILVLFIIPLYRNGYILTQLTTRLNLFLSNRSLFDLHNKQIGSHNLPEDYFSIVVGNINSEKTMTAVLDPFCHHCSDFFLKLYNWLLSEPEIKVLILFYNDDNQKLTQTNIINHMFSLYKQQPELILSGIKSWFEIRDFSKWSKIFPNHSSNDLLVSQMREKQQLWCRNSNIRSTPSFFYNGHQIVEPYTLESIIYLSSS